jgi:integrase
LEAVVRGSKRGRTRTVPLHADVVEALKGCYTARPPASTDALFVSLRQRQSATTDPLSLAWARSATSSPSIAAAAGVREDRGTAHALRHTFCTMLAERDVALEVIRALAGHVDVRTTQIYVDVTDQRKADAIAALDCTPHPLAA